MFIELLADSNAPLITESFLKWVVGGMALGYVGLVTYIKALVAKNHEILGSYNNQRNEIENPLRDRYTKILDQKDGEIDKLESEIARLYQERLEILKAQIEDSKKQEYSLAELSRDYNELVDHIIPLIENNVDLLNYYRDRRESLNRRNRK